MHEVRMPKLDHMAEEAVLLSWHKSEGEQVREGDVLFEFESEKATEEVRAEVAGILLKIVFKEGDTVPVSGTVAIIGERGEEISADRADKATGDKGPAEIRIAPLARKLARIHHIDLEQLNQKFPGKVIKKEDVEAFIARQGKPSTEPRTAPGGAVEQPGAASQAMDIGDTTIELKGIRKTMFDRMSRAASTYASTTTVQKADVTELVELKSRLTRDWEGASKPRYIAFFMKAVSMALPEFPVLNSTVNESAGLIYIRKAVNLGIAVSSKSGLIVPVLHGVSNLNLREITVRTNKLLDRVTSDRLNHEDFANGTFTITNAGPLGAYLNTPMINPPQSAILGTCSMNDEPAVVNGQILPRKLMFLTLTYDHRVIEGAEAVGFLKKIVALLEEPIRLL